MIEPGRRWGSREWNLVMPLAYGLIQPVDVKLPNLPHELDGMRILHVSDLHIRRHGRLFSRLINQLTSIRHDLTVFTGDYMSYPGDEDASIKVMKKICERLNPSMGMYGVFGNHDFDEFRQRAGEELPIHWLSDHAVSVKDRPLDLLGFNVTKGSGPDGMKVAMDATLECGGRDEDRLRLGLLHYPQKFMLASDLGVDLMLSGHTHGGQIRLPGGRALFNSSDLPLGLSSGLMRHRDMMIGVSRGVGYAGMPFVTSWRLFCPSHMPLYTLRRGPMTGKRSNRLEMIQRW
ncbi:metallophosphoesterase [Poriferisphaera corsica]|uniref:metallophosphoesterase n=1 Tax=Poriferisphaera corsica TaxID=2528020 RepID=UPI00190AD342|nr:metallophosphoesterase [Poriferisphaera corsica]